MYDTGKCRVSDLVEVFSVLRPTVCPFTESLRNRQWARDAANDDRPHPQLPTVRVREDCTGGRDRVVGKDHGGRVLLRRGGTIPPPPGSGCTPPFPGKPQARDTEDKARPGNGAGAAPCPCTERVARTEARRGASKSPKDGRCLVRCLPGRPSLQSHKTPQQHPQSPFPYPLLPLAHPPSLSSTHPSRCCQTVAARCAFPLMPCFNGHFFPSRCRPKVMAIMSSAMRWHAARIRQCGPGVSRWAPSACQSGPRRYARASGTRSGTQRRCRCARRSQW